MKKKKLFPAVRAAMVSFVIILILPGICVTAGALSPPEESSLYADVFGTVDSETAELLEKLGLFSLSPENLLEITPSAVFSLIGEIFRGESESPFTTGAVIILILIAAGIFLGLTEGGAYAELTRTVGAMCLMFALIRSSSGILSESMSSVRLTGDFMLGLIPLFAGVISFSGNPALALTFNTAVLGFAEGISGLFSQGIPLVAAISTSAAVSSVINPLADLSEVGRLFNKTVNLVMGFASGVFTAVLSLKSVIASAEDTLGLKGLKFFIGNGIPIVGGAIGDALNTAAAGLLLVKNSIGIFAVIVLFLINLPAFVRLVMWKLSLRMIAFSAELMRFPEVSQLAEALNGLFSVIMGVICFNMFTYIISVAAVLAVKTG